MEILMKTYEYRFHPAGHVYKVKVNSMVELQTLFNSRCSDDWKRGGEAYFKTEADSDWLELEEFILRYFKHELRLPTYQNDSIEFLGYEDENGKFEERKRPGEVLDEEELLMIEAQADYYFGIRE